MISLVVVCAIVCIHFVADFVFQTHAQAVGKSKNFRYLVGHTLTYSLTWFIIGVFFFPVSTVLWFTLITFGAHTLTDHITSRINAALWSKGNIHNFFVGIGADQVLHYVQLFITFYLLTKN